MKRRELNYRLFEKNRIKFQDKILENELYIVKSKRNKNSFDLNFFYLCGIEEENSILLISKTSSVLFIEKPSREKEIWEGKMMDKEEARDISGIKNIEFLEDYEKILRSLEYKSIIPQEDEKFIEILTSLRIIKEKEELDSMIKASRITLNCLDEIKKEIMPGMWEYEIEAIMDYEFKRNKACQHSFPPIIASGENALYLHYQDNNSQLKDKETILLDFGARKDLYTSDYSFTLPINGEFTPRQLEAYNKVENIQKEVIKQMVVGNTINNLNIFTNQLIINALLELGLITKKELEINPLAYKKYYPHSVSHFMGLEAHDVGSREEELKNNMVLSCEPGIYIPEEKLGIRLETNIIIQNQTPINIIDLI